MSVMCFRFCLCFTCYTNTSDNTGYHAYSLPMLHNWSAGHFSPSRIVLCSVFWLILLVCFFFGLVLFFGFCYVTEL